MFAEVLQMVALAWVTVPANVWQIDIDLMWVAKLAELFLIGF